MENSELLSLAKEYANTQDLYKLLGIDALSAKEEKAVQRAWRKTSIKYHPDKAGSEFDSSKWQLLERARDVLLDVAARDAYDSARSAALQREIQKQAMNAKKRAMIDDLEARERGHMEKKARIDQDNAVKEQEIRRLAEAGRRRQEERQREMREADERMRKTQKEKEPTQKKANVPAVPAPTEDAMKVDHEEFDPREAEIQRKLQELQERKAAKKAEKAAKKEASNGNFVAPSVSAATPRAPPDPSKTGAQADENKGTPSKSFSFATPKASPAPSTASTPRVKGDFSSTMARLRAAQAEKERRKAEESAKQVDAA